MTDVQITYEDLFAIVDTYLDADGPEIAETIAHAIYDTIHHCRCAPDNTGEDIDINPACPRHGALEPASTQPPGMEDPF